MTEVRTLDSLLPARVLEGRAGLRVYIHRPSPQLAFYEGYARFAGDEATFADVCTRLGLARSQQPESAGLLPAAWSPPAELSLPWWDAAPSTPAAAAARAHGTSGWIVAKHERGHVYLIATDTGVP